MPAGDPAKGGVIFGSVTFNPDSASNLLAGLTYVNIHTALNPGGEIRGQLVLVTNTAPSLECPAPLTRECTSSNGALVDLAAKISDADGDALTVVWTVDGSVLQTNAIPAGSPGTTTNVHFIANFAMGSHQIGVSASDGVNPAVACSTTVTVVDTTPPDIQRITATPRILWPPNHKLVTVKVNVVAIDACGPVRCKIVSISSNEPENGLGDGDTDHDWEITGDLTLKLRAERSGKGHGRIYTIGVECADAAGNKSTGSVAVSVPHNQGFR
jgi:hypothetical protein